MNTTTSPPPALPSIRLTIPVESDVHAVFQRMAKARGISTGRAMGDWLGDTIEAAEFMASTMERAREAPKTVIRELQAYTLGMTDELSTIMSVIAKKGIEDRAHRTEGARLRDGSGRSARPLAARGMVIPPSCNTGGKVPEVGKPSKRRKVP